MQLVMVAKVAMVARAVILVVMQLVMPVSLVTNVKDVIPAKAAILLVTN